MASTILLTLCLGMLAMCLAVPTSTINWCVKSEHELKKCRDLSRTCSSDQTTLTCVHKASTDDCITAIANKVADAVTLDSGYIYRASMHPHNLKPIMAENYGTEKDVDTCYYAVALVKKGSSFLFKDLRGKRSCHTAVFRTAGWVVPIGILLAENQIPWEGPEEQSIQKAVTEFFTASCAPGAEEEKLCKQCAGKKENKCKLSPREPYYGYDGARRCLEDGMGDVAFVKHIIPEKYNNGYELLCIDNERRPISEYKNCYWGRVPAHAVVSDQDEEKTQLIIEFLQQAQNKQECKLFSSPHGIDLMFKDSSKSLLPLPAKFDAALYLGKKLTNAMKALEKESEKPSQDKIHWCTHSKEEKTKCDSWTVASEGKIECVEAYSAEDCITKTMKGEADAFTTDGGYAHTAGACGLVPAMGEIYDARECKTTGTTTGSYYAVAVIKAKDKDKISWTNLRGKRSCHTGFTRTAGWIIPVGLIYKETGECDMSKFFKESCVPGADKKSNLCNLCTGDPNVFKDDSKCAANDREQYYGYQGALRCLVFGNGDVAFVKHLSVDEFTKSNSMKKEEFLLLCRDGSTKPVTEYKECHLAEVPGHVVVTSPERREVVTTILQDQQMRYGKDAENPLFSMFKSEGRKDLLFKDSTQCLREIKAKDFLGYFGKDYNDAVASLSDCTQSELMKACVFHTCKF